MKNVLITGGNGFVGRYTTKGLEEEHGFFVHSKSHKSLDVTRPQDFPSLEADAVVHTAGLLSIEHFKPRQYFDVNIYGTYNVCEFCRHNDVKTIVFTMTHSDVNQSDSMVISEDTPRKYGGDAVPYIVSKIAAMELVQNYGREYGIRPVILRLPGIRGYGSRDTKCGCAFHLFIKKALVSEPIEVWGKHDVVRDLVYVKDVVNAIIKSLKNKKAKGLYNIGSGVGLTIEDEVKAIIEAFSPKDKPSRIVYRPDIEVTDTRSYIFNISKAKRDFGYVPVYSYLDAMKDFKEEMEVDMLKHEISEDKTDSWKIIDDINEFYGLG